MKVNKQKSNTKEEKHKQYGKECEVQSKLWPKKEMKRRETHTGSRNRNAKRFEDKRRNNIELNRS